MSHVPPSTDPKVKAYLEKTAHRDRKFDILIRRLLRILEQAIAALAIAALVGALALEVYEMFTSGSNYFSDVSHMLHNLLSIVVGLEFVRMLIDTTPANILEVLTVAITRHVVLSHDDYFSNIACIACIAGLFAIRRFLIRPGELKEEMVENE